MQHRIIALTLLTLAGFSGQAAAGALGPTLANLGANLNLTLSSALAGNTTLAVQGAASAVGGLLADTTAGTPLDGLGSAGVGLGNTLVFTTSTLTPTVDTITRPTLQPLAPVTAALTDTTDQVLGPQALGQLAGALQLDDVSLADLPLQGLPLDSVLAVLPLDSFGPGALLMLLNGANLPGF